MADNISSTSLVDVKEDHAKVDLRDFMLQQDFSSDFAELDQLEADAYAQRTFWDRLMYLEYKMDFKNKAHMTYFLGFFASMAGILSGLDQLLISGANVFMPKALGLTDHEESLVSSLMPLGAVLGSIIISPLNEYVGRRPSLVISCLFYTLGAGLCAGARNVGTMYAGRFTLGIGIGIEGGCVGIYVAECCLPHLRGGLVSLYQMNIALGEVLGYAVAAIFYDVPGNWRFILGSSLVFSTILFIGLFFLPESPRFLIHKEKYGEAYGVWKRLRDISDDNNKLEFMEMRQAAMQEHQERVDNNRKYLWTDFFTKPRARRALVYSNIMIFLGQFTGVNGIMYYMLRLMSNIGFTTKNSVFMSLVGGGALLIGTIPAVLLMDRFGRRLWANTMLPMCFLGLLLVGIGYLINIDTNLPAAEGVYLTGLIIYMGFFGSYACLTWVVPAESFPTYLRSYGMTVSSANLYLCAFIITYNFSRMQKAMSNTGLTLGFFGGIAVVGWIYQMLCMPETKNKTLEEIDDIFEKPTKQIMRENLANMGIKWLKV